MEQESGRETAEVTGTTRERIENARKRLDIAEKWELPTMDQNIFAIVELADEVKKLSDMNASLGSMVNDKIAEIKRLEAELAALKEKCRWHKYQDEPLSSVSGYVLLYYKAYDGEEIFVMGDAREVEEQYAGVWGITPDRQVYKLNILWRPLDLPEMGEAK